MLRGDRVDLKPFSLDDLEFLFTWNNDPEYVGEYEPFEPVSEEELSEWLPKPKKGRRWFIIQRKDGEKVGQLVVTEKDSSTVQVGYRVAPPHRNRGYCTEAVRIIVNHLFAETDIETVTAKANPRNFSSLSVLEKVGFTRTTYKEKAIEFNDHWLDGYVYQLRRAKHYS
jgi:RimJ/RimL family protein N-acetyltransferase